MNGILGARKYPVRLANNIGTKYVNPVSVPKIIVVLIGVLVTHALIAAMQLTMANVVSTPGNKLWIINPSVVPTKNKGMINPPLHPEVTVMAMASILKTRIRIKKFSPKLPPIS